MVTHDPLVAARAHMVLHLEKGVLVEGVKSRQNVPAGGVA
jgi:ABC-type lipoprotein export system ATPase subunit